MICIVGMETRVPSVIPLSFGISHGKNSTHLFLNSLCFFSLKRWEKEIDWMAMNGINLVYATTAMEYIFNKVRIFNE